MREKAQEETTNNDGHHIHIRMVALTRQTMAWELGQTRSSHFTGTITPVHVAIQLL